MKPYGTSRMARRECSRVIFEAAARLVRRLALRVTLPTRAVAGVLQLFASVVDLFPSATALTTTDAEAAAALEVSVATVE